MVHTHEPSESLKVCNSILGPRERREINRAAKFAHANRHMSAERIREQLGYSYEDCQIDMDKIGGTA